MGVPSAVHDKLTAALIVVFDFYLIFTGKPKFNKCLLQFILCPVQCPVTTEEDPEDQPSFRVTTVLCDIFTMEITSAAFVHIILRVGDCSLNHQ